MNLLSYALSKKGSSSSTPSTSYDDSALTARVEALEQKVDNDTIYDDTELSARVTALEEAPAPEVYNDTPLKNRVTALENQGAFVDWNSTSTTNKNYIKNKPFGVLQTNETILATVTGLTTDYEVISATVNGITCDRRIEVPLTQDLSSNYRYQWLYTTLNDTTNGGYSSARKSLIGQTDSDISGPYLIAPKAVLCKQNNKWWCYYTSNSFVYSGTDKIVIKSTNQYSKLSTNYVNINNCVEKDNNDVVSSHAVYDIATLYIGNTEYTIAEAINKIAQDAGVNTRFTQKTT